MSNSTLRVDTPESQRGHQIMKRFDAGCGAKFKTPSSINSSPSAKTVEGWKAGECSSFVELLSLTRDPDQDSTIIDYKAEETKDEDSVLFTSKIQ